MYITLGVRDGGSAPILQEGADLAYSNPLPHVLILTAIVVSLSTMAVALALIIGGVRSTAPSKRMKIATIDRAEAKEDHEA